MTTAYYTNTFHVNRSFEKFPETVTMFVINKLAINYNHWLLKRDGTSTEMEVITFQCEIPDNLNIATVEQGEAIAFQTFDEEEFVYSAELFMDDIEFEHINVDDIHKFIQDMKCAGYDGAMVPDYDGTDTDVLMLFNGSNAKIVDVYKREPY